MSGAPQSQQLSSTLTHTYFLCSNATKCCEMYSTSRTNLFWQDLTQRSSSTSLPIGRLLLLELLPLLSSADTDGHQDHINQLWRYMVGVLLYTSSGAGRGVEVTRIHAFSEFQEFFNSLHFGMRSFKNITHGIDNNPIVSHFVSPHLSRYIVIIMLVFLPAVQGHSVLSWPDKSKAPEEANLMFREVMKLDNDEIYLSKQMGTKDNRDFCAMIMNFISPKSLAKTSTSPENCRQFHHGPAMHDKTYSSEVYLRDSSGTFVRAPLMTARSWWAALGEPLVDRLLVLMIFPTPTTPLFSFIREEARAQRGTSLCWHAHWVDTRSLERSSYHRGTPCSPSISVSPRDTFKEQI